jgi:type IV fimbrial biogenesis protein FimT
LGWVVMRKDAGFTLVELLVTVSIIAILATMAAPSIGQSLANQRVKQAAFELAQTLKTARSNAILYRRALAVRPSYTGKTNSNWNGTSGLYNTNVPVASQALVSAASWYVFETGTTAATTTATDNRVTATSKVDSSVDVNLPNVVSIQFLPDSSVQTQATQGGAFTTTAQTQTFTVCSTNTNARANTGRQVSVSRFGNVTVSEKSTGVC